MMSRISQTASLPKNSLPCGTVRGQRAVLGLWCAMLALLCSPGCSTLLGRTKGPMDNLDTKSMKAAGYTFGSYGTNRPLETPSDDKPSIVLEVQDGKRNFERIPMVPGQSLFVADVVRDAQLHKKLGRIRLTVLRPNGPSKPPVRLDVDFDDSGKHVMEGQNYSLRSGDHVVVTLDERSFLTGMMPELPFMKR